ncbi:MAG: hypothetical protein QOJ11_3490 [Frankiales bacterium]|nr:hypothetical protein [Frankiales bacterium]
MLVSDDESLLLLCQSDEPKAVRYLDQSSMVYFCQSSSFDLLTKHLASVLENRLENLGL